MVTSLCIKVAYLGKITQKQIKADLEVYMYIHLWQDYLEYLLMICFFFLINTNEIKQSWIYNK